MFCRVIIACSLKVTASHMHHHCTTPGFSPGEGFGYKHKAFLNQKHTKKKNPTWNVFAWSTLHAV